MARGGIAGPRRLGVSISANVFVGNDRFVGRVVTLTEHGVVLVPSVRVSTGTFVRLNLALPGTGVLDVDMLLVQQIDIEGWTAWRLRFFDSTSESARLMRQYLAAPHADDVAVPRRRRQLSGTGPQQRPPDDEPAEDPG